MGGAVVEQTHVVERSEDADNSNKDVNKKKKRRSNRRSKQNSSVSACSSVDELHADSSEFVGGSGTSNEQQLPRASNIASNEQQLPRASNIAFISLPTMLANVQAAAQEGTSMQNQHFLPSDYGDRMYSKSCPVGNKDSLLPYRRNFFAPHWSSESVNEALEKGHIFKALFRVNAHNRLEAYCKIDGVQTDILINGIPAQNRAVEGDIVAIKVDNFSSWVKMKGSAGSADNSGLSDDNNSLCQVSELVRDSSKGKNKVDVGYECENSINCSFIEEKGFRNASFTPTGADVGLQPIGHCTSVSDHSYSPVNGRPSALDLLHTVSSSDRYDIPNSVEKLCALMSAFPSKRPTGRVVAIVQRSRRRDTIVGFLSVTQCLGGKEVSKIENKKKKSSLLPPNLEYIRLTPTDPKFPKMMVCSRDLPKAIRKRLEDGDQTVETELLGAQIGDWSEGEYAPQARVMHIFGRGGEIEPHISAILFENAIPPSEFSAESLSCIPSFPWEVPSEELRRRRDLRHLCVFTIDPSTATDLDDALSVERFSSGVFRVGVHIADVSYFVLPNTALDMEAQFRSTSVYLLQGKLPMLPPLLSDNVGSLNPGVDRLAFSVLWDINLNGEIMDQWIGRTVIRSCCKLSYENAQDIIDGLFDVGSFIQAEDGVPHPQLHDHFHWSDVNISVKCLHEISLKLKEKRFDDGALRLESSKLVFLFDEDGTPYDSILSERKDSNFLVEEFMLLANRTAAEVIFRAYPDCALLRRHPDPNLRKLKEFQVFCRKHGFELDASCSGQLHRSLEKIRDALKNDSVLFNILVSYATKPMQLAEYFCSGDLEGENYWGHYALAVPLYTHFTSPLRRYPDIVVHRTLAAITEAEEWYLKHGSVSRDLNNGNELIRRCFSGPCFDKDAAVSIEGQKALSVAASKYGVPCTEALAELAAYCNERKLASRHVKDASDKLYMWFLLRKKEVLLTEARVLGLGPRFMSIYVPKLAIERRIYYDEVEDLTAEWLENTSTLVLNLSSYKRFPRRGSPGKRRTVEEVALITCPLELALDFPGDGGNNGSSQENIEHKSWCASQIAGQNTITGLRDPAAGSVPDISDAIEVEPAVFPFTVQLLSTIPVALHAVGGDDGPLDIAARLYMSSYF